MVEPRRVERRRPTLDSVDDVTFLEQEFRQEGAVLARHSGNQCDPLRHLFFSPVGYRAKLFFYTVPPHDKSKWAACSASSPNAPKSRRTRQLDPFLHLSYSPAPSQKSAGWILRTNHRFRSIGAMSESTPTGTVDTVQNNNGNRAKAAFIVGGTVVLFLVGAVAFQFLRPKVGAAQENAPDSGRSDGRSSATRPALARVNGELIAYDSVADECMQRYGQDVLESFINRTIIDQACRKQHISITQAEVNAEIVKIAKKFDIDPKNWLQIIQSERHLSPLQYKEDIIWPMLALKRLAGSEVKITDDELQRVFIREYGERVKARMIMCDKLQRAQEAWNLVQKDPASFGKVARERLDRAYQQVPRRTDSAHSPLLRQRQRREGSLQARRGRDFGHHRRQHARSATLRDPLVRRPHDADRQEHERNWNQGTVP